MRADVTAIVMSREPFKRDLGVPVCNVVSTIDSHPQMYATRLATLALVSTQWCFWFDDDDELPDDADEVLDACIAQAQSSGATLAYTHEVMRTAGRPDVLRPALPYDRVKHLNDSLFVHHLGLMRTACAQAVAALLPPSGDYWAEHAVYATLGRMHGTGAVAVNRVGYIWHNHPDGMHLRPGMLRAQINTRLLLDARFNPTVKDTSP